VHSATVWKQLIGVDDRTVIDDIEFTDERDGRGARAATTAQASSVRPLRTAGAGLRRW
jgi:hypothetical protein